jgi:hypothetical protein
MEQPGFSAKLVALSTPQDLPSLRQALTMLAREILSMMSQPGYLSLVRMIIAGAALPAARHPLTRFSFTPEAARAGLQAGPATCSGLTATWRMRRPASPQRSCSLSCEMPGAGERLE